MMMRVRVSVPVVMVLGTVPMQIARLVQLDRLMLMEMKRPDQKKHRQ
jgi:hypothetical protein